MNAPALMLDSSNVLSISAPSLHADIVPPPHVVNSILGAHAPTMADTLANLAPHIPLALVSERAYLRLIQTARTMPAALSHCCYLECHPGNRDHVDFTTDVNADGALMIAGSNPRIGLSPMRRADPAWAPVISFTRAWTSEQRALRHDVAGAWLEFDLESSGRSAAAPSLFVDFSDRVARDPSVARRLASLLAMLAEIDRAPSSVTRHLLHVAIAALPSSASLLYMGAMLARTTSAIRLCIRGLSRADLLGYLVSIQWRGDARQLAALTTSLATGTGGGQQQPAIVHLDIGEEIEGSIGLEYPLARHPQLHGVIAESALLDHLVTRGLLAPQERAALCAWPGYEQRTLAHEIWPSVVVRRVNHLKFVMSPTGATTVKVYLCAESMARAELRALAG